MDQDIFPDRRRDSKSITIIVSIVNLVQCCSWWRCGDYWEYNTTLLIRRKNLNIYILSSYFLLISQWWVKDGVRNCDLALNRLSSRRLWLDAYKKQIKIAKSGATSWVPITSCLNIANALAFWLLLYSFVRLAFSPRVVSRGRSFHYRKSSRLPQSTSATPGLTRMFRIT